MAIVRVRARVVTTHEIPAYGGTQLDEEQVSEVAEAISSGRLPMHFQHDISRPVAIANVTAGTELLEDGHLAAWAEFDVDEEAWSAYEREVAAAGAPGGMSISFTTPLPGGSSRTDSPVMVAADAHHFTDDEIRAAVEELRRLGPEAEGRQLRQFSHEPVAKVIFEVLLPLMQSLGPNIAAAIIYDSAKHFFLRPNRPDRIVLNVVLRENMLGGRKTKVHLEVHSLEQLRTALSGLPDVIETGARGTFASTEGEPLRKIESGEHHAADD